MANRNSWKLCKAHENCAKCKKCVDCWKRKAWRHAGNASALKFVLMCMLDERTQTINEVDGEGIPPLPVITETGKEMKFMKCGICAEKITIQGQRDMCSLSCGHTICYSCASNEIWRREAKCPFCRKVSKKIVKLFYEAEPEGVDNEAD